MASRKPRASADAFRDILAIKAWIERDVLPRFGSRRQDNAQALMRHLYARPVVDINMAAEIIGATTNTATALITDMVAHGVLVEVTGRRRNRLFVFSRYIGLFTR